MSWNCRETRLHLARFLDGEASPAQRALVDSHLASCPACRACLETMRSADRLTKDAGSEPDLSDQREFGALLARMRSNFDLDEAARLREAERAAHPEARALSAEEIASATLERSIRRNAGALHRIGQAISKWFAPAPRWRWAGIASATAAAVVITIVLVARNPQLPQEALEHGMSKQVDTPVEELAGPPARPQDLASPAPEQAPSAVPLAPPPEEAAGRARDDAAALDATVAPPQGTATITAETASPSQEVSHSIPDVDRFHNSVTFDDFADKSVARLEARDERIPAESSLRLEEGVTSPRPVTAARAEMETGAAGPAGAQETGPLPVAEEEKTTVEDVAMRLRTYLGPAETLETISREQGGSAQTERGEKKADPRRVLSTLKTKAEPLGSPSGSVAASLSAEPGAKAAEQRHEGETKAPESATGDLLALLLQTESRIAPPPAGPTEAQDRVREIRERRSRPTSQDSTPEESKSRESVSEGPARSVPAAAWKDVGDGWFALWQLAKEDAGQAGTRSARSSAREEEPDLADARLLDEPFLREKALAAYLRALETMTAPPVSLSADSPRTVTARADRAASQRIASVDAERRRILRRMEQMREEEKSRPAASPPRRKKR